MTHPRPPSLLVVLRHGLAGLVGSVGSVGVMGCVGFAGVMGFAGLALQTPATARAEPDAPAPSLAVPSDPGIPYYALAVTSDVLAYAFGSYGADVEAALTRHHAVGGGVAVELPGSTTAVAVSLRYHAWLLGDGLSGVYIGPAVDLLVRQRDDVGLGLALEAGLSGVHGGLLVSAGARLAMDAEEPMTPRLVMRVALGYAFL